MVDIINVLPENVANQIAAGEVIQRPASAVKELLENAVDSGATSIDLLIKDAGRTLIQVSDNGCGMSANDLKRSIQRHATSKIHAAEDLFAIRTLGFRGEALASIASIAQLEIKTRQVGRETGTRLEAEGTDIKACEETACPEGTVIAVKNLFYNVPARRRFLKSNTAEMRHILEEFYHVALVFPAIAFSIHHNGRVVHKVTSSKLLQRIITLFGDQYRERLLPVELSTDQFSVSGYIGKPKYARKTRGEQYFFANQRYIRHPYLHHAVMNAFQELIPDNAHPAYFLHMEVDPASIDVNIHPTKTEIKFQDEKMIYGMLKSAVRESLGKSEAMPSLDFDREKSFELPPDMLDKPVKPPEIKINPDFNPFDQSYHSSSERERHNREKWTELFSSADRSEKGANEKMHPSDMDQDQTDTSPGRIFQVQRSYIISTIKSGLLIVHQQRAHEKILFERFFASLKTQKSLSQKQLFPINVHFSPQDAGLLSELLDELQIIGFDIREMGGRSFVVDGIPADSGEKDIQSVLESFIETCKMEMEQNKDQGVSTAKAMAKSLAVPMGQVLKLEEMNALIDGLFACNNPELSPDGKPTLIMLKAEDLKERFK